MIKILIVTHGALAVAFKESSAMFFGSASDAISTIGLFPMDSPETLCDKIAKEIETIDDGSGVLIFVDILAGSPYNMTAMAIDALKEEHRLECFTGVNLPILMEALAGLEYMCISEMVAQIESVSQDSITNLRKKLDI